MAHHTAGLARLTRGTHPLDFTEQIARDYTRVALTPRERALLDYASKLTRTPWEVVESDLEPMRAAGLSDADILDANLTVAYYAYANRIAQGLGVEVDEYVEPQGIGGKRPAPPKGPEK